MINILLFCLGSLLGIPAGLILLNILEAMLRAILKRI